ncbi:MAG TPA: hypothetical protein VKT54_02285 [Steroidobacteraceae bacterium]|nr:hypothetical protein [Steroidobacteraceae bacterium]
MRPITALLACLSALALAPVLADPPAATTTTTSATTTTTAPAEKPAVNADVEHFLAEGYKPETRGGKQVYCRKQTEIGTRIGGKTVCGTIEELRVREQRAQNDMQQSQSGH